MLWLDVMWQSGIAARVVGQQEVVANCCGCLMVLNAIKSHVCGAANGVCCFFSCAVQEVIAALMPITCKAEAVPLFQIPFANPIGATFHDPACKSICKLTRVAASYVR